MKDHQIIFTRIKEFLPKHFDGDIVFYEDETHITLGESGIWLACDESELTIGYEMNYRHYHHEYDDINEAIEEFFNLLTRKKRVTKFYKGKYQYKKKTEVENDKGEYTELSTAMIWLYPYWKKTEEKVEIVESLISYSRIKQEILEIKSCVK